MADGGLAGWYLAAAGGDTRGHTASTRDLEEELARLTAEATRAWPSVRVAPEDFVRYLGERVAPGEPPSSLQASDLYLALACGRGDPAAIAEFERRYMRELARLVSRVRLGSEALADLAQRLRADLFVGPAPKIAAYSGRGELMGWLRVVSLRAALKIVRGKAPAKSEDDALAEQAALAVDPERALASAAARELFLAAFRSAVASLGDFERLVLREHHLDGLSLDEIARLHGLHRSAVYRRIEQARAQVMAATRRTLEREHRLTASECASLLREAQSRMDLTFSSVFRDGPPQTDR